MGTRRREGEGQRQKRAAGAQTAGGRRRRGRTGAPDQSRAGTFRRKLATTCSKGYLYTWCTSTVTPIPARPPRPPRLRERRATRAPPRLQATTRGRPRGRGFFSSSFKLGNFIVPLGETDKQSRPRPLPPTSSVGGGGAGEARPALSGPTVAAWRRLERPGGTPPRGACGQARSCPPGLGALDFGTCLCLCVTPWSGATEEAVNC